MNTADVVVTNSGLEKARALHPPLAVAGDREARAALAAMVAAGPREAATDFRTGESQEIVALHVDSMSEPFGVAIVKSGVVVTVLDVAGGRYVRARGRRPATPPRLRRVDVVGDELARYHVDGCVAVSGLVVDRDGGVELVGVGPGGRHGQ